MTVRLATLLEGLVAVPAGGDLAVSGLSADSRTLAPGEAFIALAGMHRHGIEFVGAAIARGASVVLAEAPARAFDGGAVPVIWIERLGERLGTIAARFHGDPSASLRVIGVTGTNGKTSTVQLLAQALERLGHRAATIGTLGAGFAGELKSTGFPTTPDALITQRVLAELRDAGATHVAMEVSSHGLHQHRVGGVRFEVAAFTNLTRDHLDYHGSMEAYGAAKAMLFAWPGLKAAVINIDDAFGRELAATLPAGVARWRTSAAGAHEAEVAAGDVSTSARGLSFALHAPGGNRAVHSALLGRFNAANLLTVAACLGALGEDFDASIDALEAARPVDGRMNRLDGADGQPLVVVDYAHTPDALEQALAALRAHCAGRLFCVFGCGGERDAGKRPQMGAIAARLADVAIVTDDNPRREDGDAIVAQILAGMDGRAVVERDRARAIGRALDQAGAGDVVLIAGKGHEPYQEGPQGKLPFDDMAVARAVLVRLAGERAA